LSGRTAEAVELLEGAVESARLAQNAVDLVWTLFNSAYASFTRGDIEAAMAKADESWELAQTIEPGPIPAASASALPPVLPLSGAAAGEDRRMVGGSFRAGSLYTLTRARVAAGRFEAAERSARAAGACADHVALPVARAMAELSRAEVELAAGDAAAAGRRAV